jgi:hypothetical protein
MMPDSGNRLLERSMRFRFLIAIVGIAALPVLGMPPRAMVQHTGASPIAQPSEPALPSRSVRRRITINPRPLLYRRCEDWYEVQNRPSGTVLYPQMRCWWVRG